MKRLIIVFVLIILIISGCTKSGSDENYTIIYDPVYEEIFQLVKQYGVAREDTGCTSYFQNFGSLGRCLVSSDYYYQQFVLEDDSIKIVLSFLRNGSGVDNEDSFNSSRIEIFWNKNLKFRDAHLDLSVNYCGEVVSIPTDIMFRNICVYRWVIHKQGINVIRDEDDYDRYISGDSQYCPQIFHEEELKVFPSQGDFLSMNNDEFEALTCYESYLKSNPPSTESMIREVLNSTVNAIRSKG